MDAFRVHSRSAYASVGSAIDLSSFSILLKERFRLDNRLGVRGQGSKAFSNSVCFGIVFDGARMHVKVFSTGTLHTSGAHKDLERAFQFITQLIFTCHVKNDDPSVSVIRSPASFGLRDVRIAMIYSVYQNPARIDCGRAYIILRARGLNAMYDVNLHRALNVRLDGREGTFLIFGSGKVIMTGGTSVDVYERRWGEVIALMKDATIPPPLHMTM